MKRDTGRHGMLISDLLTLLKTHVLVLYIHVNRFMHISHPLHTNKAISSHKCMHMEKLEIFQDQAICLVKNFALP